MTTINTVPEPLSFREKVSAIWSIIRNQRYMGRTRTVLYTYQPYVAEAYFPATEDEEAVKVIFQTTARDSQLLAQARREGDLRLTREASNLRVIRRKDFSVHQIIGKELPHGFDI
jgi:hypothetical protein